MFLDGLCFITNCKNNNLICEEMVKRALNAGVRWIQYREKEKTRREIYNISVRLRKITQDFNAVFIVNDHTDIAYAVNADGVHLGQEDLPLIEARKIIGDKKIIGISTHTFKEAFDAENGGADYIGFGPIFHTRTKEAGIPKGTKILQELKSKIKIPVVAIGGITLKNIQSVIKTGVDAVAVSSAIISGDIENNVKAFYEYITAN